MKFYFSLKLLWFSTIHNATSHGLICLPWFIHNYIILYPRFLYVYIEFNSWLSLSITYIENNSHSILWQTVIGINIFWFFWFCVVICRNCVEKCWLLIIWINWVAIIRFGLTWFVKLFLSLHYWSWEHLFLLRILVVIFKVVIVDYHLIRFLGLVRSWVVELVLGVYL